MRLANQCHHLTLRAFTLTTPKQRRSWSRVRLRYLLPLPRLAGSVDDLRSTFSRMSAACFILLAPRRSCAAMRLCFQIAQSPTPSSVLEREHHLPASSPRGCSPPNARSRSIVCPFRKILVRSGRAAEAKLPQPFAYKVRACGRVCSKWLPTQRFRECRQPTGGQEEREGTQMPFVLPPPPPLHLRCVYSPLLPPRTRRAVRVEENRFPVYLPFLPRGLLSSIPFSLQFPFVLFCFGVKTCSAEPVLGRHHFCFGCISVTARDSGSWHCGVLDGAFADGWVGWTRSWISMYGVRLRNSSR